MQTVTLPNGDTAQFPDGMQPGEMQAAIYKTFPQFAPQAGAPTGLLNSVADTSLDVGRAALSANEHQGDVINKGLLALGGAAAHGLNDIGLLPDSTDAEIDKAIIGSYQRINDTANPQYQPTTLPGKIAGNLAGMSVPLAASLIAPEVTVPAFAATGGLQAGEEKIDQGGSLAAAQISAGGNALLNAAGGEVIGGAGNILSKVPGLGKALTPVAADTLSGAALRAGQGAATMAAFKPAGTAVEYAADAASGDTSNPDGTPKSYDFTPTAADLLTGALVVTPHIAAEYVGRNNLPAAPTNFADGTSALAHQNGMLFSSPDAANSFIAHNDIPDAGPIPVTARMFYPKADSDDLLGYAVRPGVRPTPDAADPATPAVAAITAAPDADSAIQAAMEAVRPVATPTIEQLLAREQQRQTGAVPDFDYANAELPELTQRAGTGDQDAMNELANRAQPIAPAEAPLDHANMQEPELVDRAQQGDPEALNELSRRAEPPADTPGPAPLGQIDKADYQWDSVKNTPVGPEFENSKVRLIPTAVDNDFDAKYGFQRGEDEEGNATHYRIEGRGNQILGTLSLEMKGDTVQKLLSLDISPSMKGKGVGSDVVGSLLANEKYLPEHEGAGQGHDDLLQSTSRHLNIFDILKQSEDFWRKAGSDEPDFQNNGRTNWESFVSGQQGRSGASDRGARDNEQPGSGTENPQGERTPKGEIPGAVSEQVKEGLTPREQAVRDDLQERINADPKGMIDEYLARNGNIIDPDRAKELSQDYVDDPSLANAVHEPSSQLAKMVFTEALKRNPDAPVMFTAGGGGSGKSETLEANKYLTQVNKGGIVFDSTLSSFKSATAKIDQAVVAGHHVNIIYTNRPANEAFQYALRRARVVPIKDLAEKHVEAANTIRQLAAHYKNDPNVKIRVFNNDIDHTSIREGVLADVPKYDYNVLVGGFHERANKDFEQGAITRTRLEALGGRASADGASGVQREARPQDVEPTGRRAGSGASGASETVPLETERRQDSAQRKTVAAMSPGEMRQALLTSDLTGLPNKRAFQDQLHENPDSRVMYSDVDDLKQLNSKYGHPGADQILKSVAGVHDQVAKEMGVKVFHRSGDEFLATHDNPNTLAAYGKEVQSRLADTTVPVKMPGGQTLNQKGVGVSYGVGGGEHTAELAANDQKAERQRLGLRSGQRDANASQAVVPSGGIRKESLDLAISKQRADWKGFQDVSTYQSLRDVPAAIRERVKGLNAETEGFYDPTTHSVHLIADAIESPERAKWVAAHEVDTHVGLRALGDKSINEALNLARGNKYIKSLTSAVAAERGIDMANPEARNRAHEEALAELGAAIHTGDFDALMDRYKVEVPDTVRNGVMASVHRVMDAVRRYVGKLIGRAPGDVPDAAVRSLLMDARQAVRNPASSVTGEGAALFSARSRTQEDTLRDKTANESNPASKVTFGAEPDLRNGELKTRWYALPDQAKSDISHAVVYNTAAKVLDSFHDARMKGELHQQLSGNEDSTSPTTTLWFDKGAPDDKIADATRLLGSSLDQKSMMRTSTEPFTRADGSEVVPSNAIVVRVPRGTDIDALYSKIRNVVDADGKPYVDNHTSTDTAMVMLHADENRISTDDLARKVADTIDPKYDVSTEPLYVDVQRKGSDDYGLSRTQKGDDSRDASLRAQSNQLRTEAGAAFDRLVSSAEGAKRSDDTEADRRQQSGESGLGDGEPVGTSGQQSGQQSIDRDLPDALQSTRPADQDRDAQREAATGALARFLKYPKEFVSNLKRAVVPMGEGSDEAMAIAKKYANQERLAQSQWKRFDDILTKNFTPDQLAKMWNAADEENDLRREGTTDATKGLSRLEPDERNAVETLHTYGEELMERARENGMFEGEGVPYWTPRMAIMVGEDGEYSKPAFTGKSDGGGGDTGRNISTNASSMLKRKYLTSAETEAAMKARLASEGKEAELVRNIRTMPMAMERMERAIAARELINQIKAIGRSTGRETVVNGDAGGGDKNYFTLDHPAFKTWRPDFNDDGTVRKDENGNLVLMKVPLKISKDFEGPIRAIMSTKPNAIYLGVMELKAKTMGLIMYSPLIHNAVEWGRALPAMDLKGKMSLGVYTYVTGHAAKNDPVQLNDAISHGLVPIGGRGQYMDITSIMEDPTLKAGRSWTAKALAAPVSIISERGAENVRRAVDAAGKFWHETLLWDRVADLQMGLYTSMKTGFMNKGMAETDASTLAAHFANRYAGALPREAMSSAAQKILNLSLFSRTFTVGNLGAMKDMLIGIPPELKAQIRLSSGEVAAQAATSAGRRKAIATFVMDVGLMYVGNALLQNWLQKQRGDATWGQIADGYKARYGALATQIGKDPLFVLTHPFNSIQSLTPNAANEEGKEGRIRWGTDANGTAIYMRLPTGKVGEEFKNYASFPHGTLTQRGAKMSTFVKPIVETANNDKGFGQKVYDDSANASLVKNISKVVGHFLAAQVPIDQIKSAYDLSTGHGDEMDSKKIWGPLVGLTFSKGAPGGPAVGEMYAADRAHREAVAQVMPDVARAIKTGDIDGATQIMESVQLTPHEMRLIIRHDTDPESRLTPQGYLQAYRHSADDEQQRLQNSRYAQ